jgi:translation elongation factor EF-Ts
MVPYKRSFTSSLQGLVAVAMEPGLAALVEVNCETDFVARNSEFSQLPGLIAASALDWAKGSGGVPLGSQSIPLEELQRERIFGGERVRWLSLKFLTK